MNFIRALAIVLLATGLETAPLSGAEAADSAEGASYLLLSNGEVLEGRAIRVADHFELCQPGGEIHLKASDVAAVCRSLGECLEHRRQLAGGDAADDHAAVFDWCVRHRLLAEAAQELAAIRDQDATHPRLELLERKLELARQTSSSAPAASPSAPKPSGAELDRMVRGMPPGAVEGFANSIQPLLMNHCATAACHGPTSESEFKLLRVASKRTADRRTTQRNLYAVLGLIDPAAPKKSPLLTASQQAHGGAKTAAFISREAPHYQMLAAWAARVADLDRAADVDDLRAEFAQSPPKRSRGRNKLVPSRTGSVARSEGASPVDVRALGDPSGDEIDAPRIGRTNSKYGTRFRTGADAGAAQSTDPFDPEIFNQRFSPQRTPKSDDLDEPNRLSEESLRDLKALDAPVPSKSTSPSDQSDNRPR